MHAKSFKTKMYIWHLSMLHEIIQKALLIVDPNKFRERR
jgi:hypothetical protein